uniref:metallophosphoesterase n=1 Tax=Alistipes sp. TaxID=1872444 RepID=UPI004056CD1F
MKKSIIKTRLLFICFVIISLTHISYSLSAKTYAMYENRADRTLASADGPYVLYQKDGSTRIITVNPQGELRDTTLKVLPNNYTLTVTSSKNRYTFQVPLHRIERPNWQYKRPKKVFVMSDPHGNMDYVVNLLQGNGVIDDKLNWCYGNNHLVIIGDIFDRGNDVTQLFWLVYKLEHEAAQVGGVVSFLLGNHETLVLANDLRYCTEKYKILADKLEVPYAQLYGKDSELGRWLATRNTIQIIDKNLYVHAGFSKAFYDWNLTIPTINEGISKALFMGKKERKASSEMNAFLYGNSGPIWYRGLVRNKEKYNPISSDTLKRILKRYGVKRLIIGHTIFSDISTFYNGKVIDVNVNNAKNRKAGLGRGLLIENRRYMVVGNDGVKRRLE